MSHALLFDKVLEAGRVKTKIGVMILALCVIPFSQNCSRKSWMAKADDHVITKHTTAVNFTELKYTANNFPASSLEESVAVDYDLSSHLVEVSTVLRDGRSCEKTFPISPAYTENIQAVLQSMSYEVVESADHLFPGDKFLKVTNARGALNLVLDSANLPNNMPKILDPYSLFYMIQGLVLNSEGLTSETCN